MARNEKVARVIDGDTFKTNSRSRSIRLANVDAPERGSKNFARATQELRTLIGGQTVTVQTVARSYGRAVAEVWVGRKSVNRAMREFLKKK